jgi:hypothetical protein
MTRHRAAICIAAVGGACALWQLTDLIPSHHGIGNSLSPYRSSANAVEAGQQRAFQILRLNEETAPRYIETSVLGAVKDPQAFHIHGSHFVQTAGGGIWVVTGANSQTSQTCLIQANTGTTACAPTSVSTRIGLTLGVVRRVSGRAGSARLFLILGIAPDWVRSVKVTTLGGSAHILPVNSNSYSMQASAPILLERYCRYRHSECQSLTKITNGKGLR